MRFKILLITMILFTILLNCKKDSKAEYLAVKNTVIHNCNLDSAEKLIFELEEVRKKNNLIDSLSNHKEGISFMSDSVELGGIQHYEIKVGYNSDLRFETYYIFYVDKNNCNEIKIIEPIEGEVMGLNDWRNLEKFKGTESLIEPINNIQKVKLPFSFYSYFKDEYSQEKYPSYKPSEKLINFLVSNDYEGEVYKCFVIPTKNKCDVYVVSIMRGDSEHFLLITSYGDMIDYKEIGVIGGDNPITFKVTTDLYVEKYYGIIENNTSILEKLKLVNNCTIYNE